MQRAGDPRTAQRLPGTELLAQSHQARHLVLGEADLVTAGVCEGEVGDGVIERGDRGGRHARHSPTTRTVETSPPSGSQGLVAHDDPAARHGKPLGVDAAQIVRVDHGLRTQRAENRHLVAVIVGERGDGLPCARDLGAQPFTHHRHGTREPVLTTPATRDR